MHQLSVSQLKEWLDGDKERPVILDVREPWELKVCVLDGSMPMPMRSVPARLDELDRDKPLAVICHHGIRSQQVCYFLAHQGFDKVYNVMGGIDAWAKQIDPSMQKY
jgi:rhodanese-related sulfurtransferase